MPSTKKRGFGVGSSSSTRTRSKRPLPQPEISGEQQPCAPADHSFCLLARIDVDIMGTHILPWVLDGTDVAFHSKGRIRRLWTLVETFALANTELFLQVLLPALTRCIGSLVPSVVKLSDYLLLKPVVLSRHLENLLCALHSSSSSLDNSKPLYVDLKQCTHCKLPFGPPQTASKLKMCSRKQWDCWGFYQLALDILVKGGVQISGIGISEVDEGTSMGRFMMQFVLKLAAAGSLLCGVPELHVEDYTVHNDHHSLLQQVLRAWPYTTITVGKIYTLNGWRKRPVVNHILDALAGSSALESLDLCDMDWSRCANTEDLPTRQLTQMPCLKDLSVRMTHPEVSVFPDGMSCFLDQLALAAAQGSLGMCSLEAITLTFQKTMGKTKISALPFSHLHMPKLKVIQIWCDTGSVQASIKMLFFLKALVLARSSEDCPLLDKISVLSSYVSHDLLEGKNPGSLRQRLDGICKNVEIPAGHMNRPRRLYMPQIDGWETHVP